MAIRTLWHASLSKNVVDRESQFGLEVHIILFPSHWRTRR